MDYKKKLEQHILFEEAIFFPYLEELLEQAENPHPFVTRFPNFSTCSFLKGHTDIESGLSEIREQLVKYNPEKAKNTPLPYRVFLTQLHYLEIDLQKHAQIEDVILIKKAIEIEKNIKLKNITN
jgi:regulator of cell morphogenesis and NO signaling